MLESQINRLAKSIYYFDDGPIYIKFQMSEEDCFGYLKKKDDQLDGKDLMIVLPYLLGYH